MKSFIRGSGSKVCVLTLAALYVLNAGVRADGAGDFKAKCAMCHGGDGAGNSATGKALKVRDLGSADVQGQTDAQLIDIVTNGKGKMPAYKGKVSEDQIKGLVAYIRTLAKK